MARPKVKKLDCGHYSETDSCQICGEREAIEAIRKRAEDQARSAASKPVGADPTHAPAGVLPDAAGATTGAIEKMLGEEPTAGIYKLPDSLYHRDPLRAYGTESLSGSSARWLIPPSTPAHYRWRMDHRNEPTDAMIFGSAVHALTMETADMAVFDGKSWTSKAGQQFLVEHDPDGDDAPILAHDVPRAKAMAYALRSHPIVAKMLAGAQFEQAIFAQDDQTGVWLRGKLDSLQQAAGDHLIVGDIKTAEHADPWRFAKAAGDLSYHISDAHYSRILRLLGVAKAVTMLYATVESSPPYLVAVHEIQSEDVMRAAELDRLAINQFAECLNADRWPGYSEHIHKISLPAYTARREEEALFDAAEEGETA